MIDILDDKMPSSLNFDPTSAFASLLMNQI
jgi:hypothetical protein